jgi:PAS domain S-box-containing protein
MGGFRGFARVTVWVTVAAIVATAGAGFWLAGRPRPHEPVRIGYRVTPYLYSQTVDGRPAGVAVDVLDEAAGRLGIDLHWTRVEVDSQNALLAGTVDLWPTVSRVSQVPGVEVTEPWLESTFRSISRVGEAPAGQGRRPRRIAAPDLRFPVDIFAEKSRGGERITIDEPVEQLQAVCTGQVDAAFMEGRQFQALLLNRPPGCEGVPLEFDPAPVATVEYAIGSTPGARRMAEALRGEIARMAQARELERIHTRWALGTSNETRPVYTLDEASKRGRWANYGVAAMTVALLVSLWQLRRNREARRLAERASTAMADYASQQERYRLLFERNLAGVVRSTADGEILDCNLAFARMAGYESREELLKTPAWKLYARPEDRKALLDRLAAEGSISNFENITVRKDGSRACLLASVTRIDEGPGKPALLEWTTIDITEQRRLEDHIRQSQKLESIGQLAGGVAHDFNNLLTAINGHTELLLADLPDDSPLRWPLEEIQKAGQRGARLTHQLLAFGRKQLLQPVLLDLNKVVTEVAGLLKRVVEEDISLEIRLDPALALVRADEGQVHQVLMNLAVNARDAMPGGGTLTLETANDDLEAATAPGEADTLSGPCVRLCVRDTGHGMDAETERRVFEPFFTTKGVGKGTGLGLSTVYGIVRQSGGLVTVRSSPGEGTTFDVFLPRAGEADRTSPDSRESRQTPNT